MRRIRSEDESYEYFDYYLEENLGWLSIYIFNINMKKMGMIFLNMFYVL